MSQEQQEEFERFLLNQMELEEETAFNKKLNSSKDLKAQFEEFKTLFFAVEEEGLRMALNDFHDTLPKKKASKKNHFIFYRIAAGIAVLMALGIWFFMQPSQHEKLFNEYFTPDPGLPTVMGNNENYAFYEAMVDYKQEHYGVAIQKWNKLYSSKPNNDTLNYFLGAAYLANGNGQNAIDHLKQSLKEGQGFFKNDAHFLLGLAYLKTNKIQLSIENLRHSNTDKGRKLAEELEK